MADFLRRFVAGKAALPSNKHISTSSSVLALESAQCSVYIKNLLCQNCTSQDGNGYIDRYELATMLRFMGETVSEDEIRDIIEEADVDRDGLIDYTEFFNMMMR